MNSRLSDRLAIADLGPGEARFVTPYAARDTVKSIYPSLRRWSDDDQCWYVARSAVNSLRIALQCAGFEVDVYRDGEFVRTYRAATARPRT